jgi:hypothetical protein
MCVCFLHAHAGSRHPSQNFLLRHDLTRIGVDRRKSDTKIEESAGGGEQQRKKLKDRWRKE